MIGRLRPFALIFILSSASFIMNSAALNYKHISKNRRIQNPVKVEYAVSENEKVSICAHCDSLLKSQEIIDSLYAKLAPDSTLIDFYNRVPLHPSIPFVFDGYRSIKPFKLDAAPLSISQLMALAGSPADETIVDDISATDVITTDSIIPPQQEEYMQIENLESSISDFEVVPHWLKVSADAWRIRNDIRYKYMITHPDDIYCAYNQLPLPPGVKQIINQEQIEDDIIEVDFPIGHHNIQISEYVQDRRYWLHYFSTGLQFSQAFVSSNWYQGGNNYLALLFNFDWNVDLNTVYKPNLLFQSALSYKLGVNSNPSGSLHKYSFSQDNFQYNLKMGLKAFNNHWFYSFNLQFKTSLFNAYPDDSFVRSAGLLSPGSLTLGLGMTYTLENEKKNFKLSASISPISYNLKTCLIDEVDHTQYGINPGRRTNSEIGSSAEANMFWKITDNIQWTSRMFLFSDYKYFLADWENTLTFNINKFLSTQLYLHPRFDSSSDKYSSKWKYWMFKEILSFGLSYTFSTKP